MNSSFIFHEVVKNRGWPSIQLSRPAHNRALRSTQTGPDARLIATIFRNMAAAARFFSNITCNLTAHVWPKITVCCVRLSPCCLPFVSSWIRKRKACLTNVDTICLCMLGCGGGQGGVGRVCGGPGLVGRESFEEKRTGPGVSWAGLRGGREEPGGGKIYLFHNIPPPPP